MTIWTPSGVRGTHPDSGKVKIGDPPLPSRKRFARWLTSVNLWGVGGDLPGSWKRINTYRKRT